MFHGGIFAFLLASGAHMKFFSLEHSPIAYGADFVAYPAVILSGLVAILVYTPVARWPALAVLVGLGLMAWTLIEYGLHRLVLHGLQPFKRWHEEHHNRPSALIGTSTPASMTLFGILIFTPIAISTDIWYATAATMGVTLGYLFYVTVHHALHHWRAKNGTWFFELKRAHALHHRPGFVGYYGVTTLFWDKIFTRNHVS